MDWFTKYTPEIMATGMIVMILFSFIWLNKRINSIEKDIAVMKTVMIMQKIMPAELDSACADNFPE